MASGSLATAAPCRAGAGHLAGGGEEGGLRRRTAKGDGGDGGLSASARAGGSAAAAAEADEAGGGRRSRSAFFVFVGVFALGITVVAFLPFFLRAYKYPTWIHLHAVVMMGWLVLFLLQVALAWLGRGDLHVRLGRATMYYTILINVTGLATGYHQVARLSRAGLDLADARVTWLASFVHPLQFDVLFFAAYRFRSRRPVHRVLMVFANAALLPPSAGRFVSNYDFPKPVAGFIVPVSMELLAVAYEWSVGGPVVLALACLCFNGLGIVAMLTVSGWPSFVAFTEWAVSCDLMPWLGGATYVYNSTSVWRD